MKDAPLHADRGEEADPDVLLYTRPDVLAYKALAAHREPANAYHLVERRGHCWPSAVLGTLWERGDRHRANGSEPYTLIRLRKPGSTEWYPASDERMPNWK